ncbi:ABC transporter substrate-binding protein [Paenibacillus sp. PvR098]|uniref:ABC transporter substrate-binding protein n=1 Tax=unclassified Paenibacillus TaxID=185978 RepID=UPI001B6069A5|nr:peptide/nickel transport system substrate-binding protein [Paenibacillus sp. PvP091]MBP1168716.1 peptide/nickel transport system substrate-binding protein [Paenibacillus sp. PvR098]MBP2439744.1 peptide/nickel transport system substrate-binding protein [Paenibacillus sp. PvP052]
MKRQSFRVILVLVAAIVLIGLVAGCSSDANPSSEASEAIKEELMMAIGSEPETGFDPTTGWGRYGAPIFQSTLLKRDHELSIVNDLATGYEITSSGTVWTVKLRNDAKFSDGKPLTAADVKYTFETAAQSGSVVDLTNMESVEATEEFTVKFTLKEAQSTFVYSLVTTGIVPKHAHGPNYAANPIGSGPYRLVQWDKGQQLIVEANPEYYGAKPFFKKLIFLFLNEDAAFAAAKAGKVDISYIPSAFSKQTVEGMRLEAVRTVDNRGIAFPTVPSGNKTKDGYPIGNDVTADIAIRQAINRAIDREALVKGVLEGHGTPAFTVNDGLPWWNSKSIIKDADLDGARSILADAGWKDSNGDGIVEKGALKAEFTLVYPASDVTRQSLAIAVADHMKAIGISIKVEGKSWDDIRTMMHSNAVLFGWGSHDPVEMYNLYNSKYMGKDLFNPGYYSNPTVDKYMTQAMKATSKEEAMEYWKKAQWDGTTGVSALGDAPWAWLVNIDHLYLVKDGLDIGKQRIHPHGHGWPVTDNIEEWKWLK